MKKFFAIIVASGLMVAGCTESKTSTNTKEEEEIEMMDTTQNKLKEVSKELEEQTEKVEKALEKLDNEFKDTQ